VAARSSRLTFRRGGFQPSCDEKSNRLLRNSAAESPFLPTGGWIRPRCQRFGFVSLAGHIDQRAKASCSLYVWSPRLRASRKSHGRDVGDAKGAMLAFNSFATRSPRRASVASTERSSQTRQLASVKTPTQIEQTRFGLFDLRAELTTLRERGLSNRRELRPGERSFFRATYAPLAWCDSEHKARLLDRGNRFTSPTRHARAVAVK
jgi:hypothetical protein